MQVDRAFDWLENYEALSSIFENFIDRENKIMHVGCGNAPLSEDMYNDGYYDMVNIDISETCIDYMKGLNRDKPMMKWLTMDAMATTFKNEQFDVIIDKSTLDAFLCSDFSEYRAAVYLNEMQRVLKTGGIYLMISYGHPRNRIHHLKRAHLDFDISYLMLYKDGDESSEDEANVSDYFFISGPLYLRLC